MRSAFTRITILAAVVSFVLPAAFLAPLRAHGDLDEQIAIITARIARAPTAALYLQRGELLRADEEYDAALRDYDRAEALDPKLDAVHLCRGLALHRIGRDEAARAALDIFLARKPDHVDGRTARARILSDRKEYAAAAADLERAIALSTDPAPELFSDCVAAQSALGDDIAALATLEAGIARVGAIPTLQAAAIELELRLGRPAAALARIDRIMAQLQRQETWLARRGEILQSLERHEEALVSYRAALASIERLAPSQRNARPAKSLEARLRTILEPAPRTAHVPGTAK
jgi:tetratricopeptide (TPR) repeat protein